MFEHFSQPLLTRLRFFRRFLRSLVLGVGIIGVSLAVGMAGFHQLEHMPWVDAFLNASMLLSGMGPLGSPATDAGKIFAGTYALYSGFIVILATGIVFAPVVHRMLHRFHAHRAHPHVVPAVAVTSHDAPRSIP